MALTFPAAFPAQFGTSGDQYFRIRGPVLPHLGTSTFTSQTSTLTSGTSTFTSGPIFSPKPVFALILTRNFSGLWTKNDGPKKLCNANQWAQFFIPWNMTFWCTPSWRAIWCWKIPWKQLKQKLGVFWKLQGICGLMVYRFFYIHKYLGDNWHRSWTIFNFLKYWDKKSPQNMPKNLQVAKFCIRVRAQSITSQRNHLYTL